MVDWLHCNLCFNQPGTGASFSLTNCGHIYCENCLTEGCHGRCKMCGSKCTTIRLSSNMKPEVEMFFTDPVDILRKSMKQTTQVIDFQKNHRRRMMSYFKDKLSKQQDVLDKAHHSISHYQHLERELIKLREENSYLKRLISEKGLATHPRSGSNPGSSRPSGYSSSPGSNKGSPAYSPGLPAASYYTKRSVSSKSSQHQDKSSLTPTPATGTGQYPFYRGYHLRQFVTVSNILALPQDNRERHKIFINNTYSGHSKMDFASVSYGAVHL